MGTVQTQREMILTTGLDRLDAYLGAGGFVALTGDGRVGLYDDFRAEGADRSADNMADLVEQMGQDAIAEQGGKHE